MYQNNGLKSEKPNCTRKCGMTNKNQVPLKNDIISNSSKGDTSSTLLPTDKADVKILKANWQPNG